MKFLIVGLGNIGSKYDNTRHNIGFDVVDAMAKKFDVEFKTDKLGDIANFKHKGRGYHLLKPSTYMNLSGKAVRYWMEKLNIKKENVLIVVDDLALPLGSIRLRGKGSDAGHNGLKNINQELGGNNYPRLRFGIGSDFSKGKQIDFVLGEWKAEEINEKDKMIKKSSEAALSFGAIGLTFTMNQFNS